MKTIIKIKQPLNLSDNYFQQANSWADDLYTRMTISKNRYQLAFYSALLLCSLLIICLIILIPTQHTELVVVHEGEDGYVWLSTTQTDSTLPTTWPRSRAEIAHYVTTRESYDPLLYNYQANEVKVLSSPQVLNEYELSQESNNKFAAINLLGDKGYRTVTINNVLPLSNIQSGKKINLAQINFVVVDHLFGDSKTIKIPYTGLISWQYTNFPTDPKKMLSDWDGFQITKYISQPVMTDSTQNM
ncbi:MAG: hypothetical protein A3E87_06600 [Gammaproteobacteria bacterium RIFCSPHIGHO2_12_FULL_35_23]|nr:MAG: hypothetical protein A3E87_06600 [Gammaproteobacteria bacterium RIFCSPHIGHO2_12_FULL_35_23]